MHRITEEMGIHKEWYEEASKMTTETLPEFLKKLTENYGHDYGTICHAIAAGALGAAWAIERSPQGGITGFQAGAIMWEFIYHWMSYEKQPLQLIKFEHMLFPQYKDNFQQIRADTWKWLQEQAAKNLKNSASAHPNVVAHWQSIVDGIVPFGYSVKEN